MAIGNVAPLAQAPSYSDMVEKQVGLINREREANLQNRLAQEESNREFRTEQLQNIYDFDVSGLPMPYINAMKDLQGKMAASLDPSSELSYDSSQKLIADIAQLNNLHIAGKRVTSTGSAAKKSYTDRFGNPTGPNGEYFAGNEQTREARDQAFDNAGFLNGEINISGTPGNWSITGVPLSETTGEDGLISFAGQGEAVDIFSNPLTLDASSIYRQEIIQGAPRLDRLESSLVESGQQIANPQARAESYVRTINPGMKEEIRKNLYEALQSSQPEYAEIPYSPDLDIPELNDAAIVAAVKERYDNANNANRTTPTQLFNTNESLFGMPKIDDPIRIVSEDEELSGKVEAAEFQRGLNLDDLQTDSNGVPLIPIEVVYVSGSGQSRRVILDPIENSEEYDQFMENLGQSGRAEMLGYSEYGAPTSDETITASGQTETEAAAEAAAALETERRTEEVNRFIEGAETSGTNTAGAQIEVQKAEIEYELEQVQEQLQALEASAAATNTPVNIIARNRLMKEATRLSEDLESATAALTELGYTFDDEQIEDPEIDPPATVDPPLTIDPGVDGPNNETGSNRDLSALPLLDPFAVQASIGISASEGYNENMQINVPDTLNSGVTIAGIDIGSTAGGADGKMDIFEVFLRPEDYEALKPMVGLTGAAAKEALSAAQAKGLLLQDGLGLEGDDFAKMAAYHISMHQLPAIYKKIPKKHFEKMDQEVKDIFINIEFMTPGTGTPKLVLKAIKSGKKKDWEAVANAYYNPNTGSTYYGDKELTDQKIANSKMENPPEGAKSIGEGNVKRVKEAGDNLRAWIEKEYGDA